jgi:hypothetical protein
MKGGLGINGAKMSMLGGTFPFSPSAIQNLSGWGMRRVKVSVDYMGVKGLSGRFRYLIVSGQTRQDTFKFSTDAEKQTSWDLIGNDGAHGFADAGVAISRWTNVLPHEQFGRVYESWSNADYVSVVFALEVIASVSAISVADFVTVTVGFEAQGPARTLS